MRLHGAAGLLGALALVAALWIFPLALFPNPGANDAPILWNAPLPIVGLTLLASLAAVVRDRVKQRPATASIALGSFTVGVAAVFVIGLMSFANLSNDRYWPFLLSPVVFAPAGAALLLVGVVGRPTDSSQVTRGLAIGVVAMLFLLAWILARGSRDWLLAPYGFDICLLIALEAGIAFAVGKWWRSPRMVASS